MGIPSDYIMFLHKKLYLIEMIARRGLSKGDEILTRIHNLCVASPNKIEEEINNIGGKHEVNEKCR